MHESLVLFKGRLIFKQYISSSRNRFGIKLYHLYASNSILLDFLVYHGNLAPGLTIVKDGSLITERIPVILIQKYLHRGHHLFINSCYASISLATYFLQNGTYITGTIRDTRKHFPVELKTITLKKKKQHFTNIMV